MTVPTTATGDRLVDPEVVAAVIDPDLPEGFDPDELGDD